MLPLIQNIPLQGFEPICPQRILFPYLFGELEDDSLLPIARSSLGACGFYWIPYIFYKLLNGVVSMCGCRGQESPANAAVLLALEGTVGSVSITSVSFTFSQRMNSPGVTSSPQHLECPGGRCTPGSCCDRHPVKSMCHLSTHIGADDGHR